jgi:carbon monoxide dehydrogenase subunit G
MELTNEFTVALPIERAWALLTDVERIAPCMPGAQQTGVEGDTYSGQVLIKLGPVTAQYKGTAAFDSRDDAAHVAVLRASGRDSRGQGTASALITATLHDEGDKTRVEVNTELKITGKVAQFGRGVIIDVSAKLLGQFVDCLGTSLVEPAPAPAVTAVSAEAAGTAPAAATATVAAPRESVPTAPLDLAALARGPVLKRAIPALGVVVVVAVIIWLARR